MRRMGCRYVRAIYMDDFKELGPTIIHWLRQPKNLLCNTADADYFEPWCRRNGY